MIICGCWHAILGVAIRPEHGHPKNLHTECRLRSISRISGVGWYSSYYCCITNYPMTQPLKIQAFIIITLSVWGSKRLGTLDLTPIPIEQSTLVWNCPSPNQLQHAGASHCSHDWAFLGGSPVSKEPIHFGRSTQGA